MSLGLAVGCRRRMRAGVLASSQLTDERAEEGGGGGKSIDSVWRTVDDLRPSIAMAMTTTTTVQPRPEGNGRHRYTDVTATSTVAEAACGGT